MKIKTVLTLLLFFTISLNLTSAQSQEKVYSLFLVNFAKGINWPPFTSQNFTIDVFAYPPLLAELNNSVANTKINGKKIEVRLINDISELKGQIVFIPAFKSKLLPEFLKESTLKKRLIVSNFPGTAKKGGAINFLLQEGKFTYEINVKSIEERGMKISSNLRSSGIVVGD